MAEEETCITKEMILRDKEEEKAPLKAEEEARIYE